MDETTLYNSALSPVGFYMKIEITLSGVGDGPAPPAAVARRPSGRSRAQTQRLGHGTRDTVRTIQYSHTVHTHERPRIKLSACPRCARALQYHCLTPMLTPVWYHSAHAPSTVQLALWAAPAPFVTPRRRPTTHWQQLPPSRRVALLRAYRKLTGAYPSSGPRACQAVAGWLASRRASSHPAVAHVPDLRQWRQPAVRAWIARRSARAMSGASPACWV